MTNDNEGPEGFTMYCDGPKVAQTLFNLLDNAMKFTGQGNIIVSAIAHDTEVIIQVQDPGVGIDPEIKDRLFEKFATKSTGGTGLGLVWRVGEDRERHRGAPRGGARRDHPGAAGRCGRRALRGPSRGAARGARELRQAARGPGTHQQLVPGGREVVRRAGGA